MSDETDDKLAKRIENALTGVDEGLNEDNIAVIIHLEDKIHRSKCLIDLIKKREIIAVYKGDKDIPYDFKKFMLKTKKEMAKEGEINDEVDTEAEGSFESNKDREGIL